MAVDRCGGALRAFLSRGFASELNSHLSFGRRCGIILDASEAFGT
uniref:Transposase n=1 Tax=Heterorhabditis bacteriophora TaxID=37862 RepID=A0A1I7W852_HETBA